MFLAFVIIIIATGMVILSSIYSVFAPFFGTFGNIVNYNVAYYGAVSAVERGQLVLKYRGPGFVGSGGRINQNTFGKASDVVLTGFNIKFEDRNGLWWTINSRTFRIPNTGEGNIDIDLRGTGSVDYNKLGYNLVENFILSIDNSLTGNYYNLTGIYRLEYGGNYISGHFRLPPKIVDSFSGSLLCSNNSFSHCDSDGDGVYDDVMVDWSLKGYYDGSQFLILPNPAVQYFGYDYSVDYDSDTMIRESRINSGTFVRFVASKNIFKDFSNYPLNQNVISVNDQISGKNFKEILSSNTGLEIRFTLVDFLRSFDSNIYPFLEYFFEFEKEVADRFYTIQGNGRKGDYDVKIIIKKPTFKESIAGSFTVIF